MLSTFGAIPQKKWYRSNTWWVDDYEKMLSDRNGLRVTFEEYFKKSKGDSTVIHHRDHLKNMTDLEISIGIFEVGTGGYIKVKRKNVFIYLPESAIFTNISNNFIGVCVDLNVSLTLAIYDLTIPRHKSQLDQLKRDYPGFNLPKFFKLKIIKDDIRPNRYWFDNRCFYIYGGFPIDKRIYFDGAQTEATKLFGHNKVITNQKIQNFSNNDKTSLKTGIAELVKAAQKVEKTVGISQEGYFLYDDTNIIKETFISELEKKVLLKGSISYFDKVNNENRTELIFSKNKLKFEEKENTFLEEITLQLSPTFSNKQIKLKKNDINNFAILIVPKQEEVGQKRKMTKVVDTLLIKGLQNYDKYTTFNSLELNFRSNYLNEKLEDYRGYTYMLTLKNMLFSARFINETQNIFIICHNLNSAKKALINTKRYNILGLVNLNEIKN